MSLAINGLLRGEFLQLPSVDAAAFVGVASTVMAIGLHVLGFSYTQNVMTAAFAIAGVGGIVITVIGAIAYAILATSLQRGNDAAYATFHGD
jgi:hypothetical protein